MRILSFSLDKSILNKESALARRTEIYGRLAEKYTVLVPFKEDREMHLSEKVNIFGVAGKSKIQKLLRIYQKAKRLLQNEKYNVLTVQDAYFLGLVGLILAKKFQLGLEIQVHGWEKFYGWRKIIARFVLKRADAIRVVSQRLKKQLISEFKIEEKKIIVAPIQTQTQSAKFRTQNYKPKLKDKFVFLTVGRLVPVKNIKMQIVALAEISKKHSEVELWIVGDGPEKYKLKNQKEKLKIADKIKFLGFKNRAELELIYQKADAFLLTSNSEGWGLTAIEAASFGLPIIMTDVGCAGEIIQNNVSGLIVPVKGQEKLETAMLQLIKLEDLRKKIGEGGRQAVLKLPDEQKTLELYQASWQKAAER